MLGVAMPPHSGQTMTKAAAFCDSVWRVVKDSFGGDGTPAKGKFRAAISRKLVGRFRALSKRSIAADTFDDCEPCRGLALIIRVGASFMMKGVEY